MQHFEFKVVPAPARAIKQRGARTGAERFAMTLAQVMNAEARDGWEYLRAETLPSEERTGFTKRTTVYHTLLVFRRALDADEGDSGDYVLVPPLAPEVYAPAAPSVMPIGDGAAPRLGSALD